MTTQQAGLSERLRWRKLSTNRAAHCESVQKRAASSLLGNECKCEMVGLVSPMQAAEPEPC